MGGGIMNTSNRKEIRKLQEGFARNEIFDSLDD